MDNQGTEDATLLRQAHLDYTTGRVDAAEILCRDILHARPDHAGALYLLGRIADRRGAAAEAIDFMSRAAAAPGAMPVHLIHHAELCRKAGLYDTALDAGRRGVAADENNPIAWFCLGNIMLETRQLNDARLCFERALTLNGAFLDARNNLALVLGRMGQGEAAIEQFRQLLASAPDNAVLHGNYATLLQELGRYEEALSAAERAVELSPALPGPHIQAATIEMLLGRHWAALGRLGLAERHVQNSNDFIVLKVHLLRSIEDFDEAVALCRDALATGMRSAELLHAYALALHLAGAEDEALAIFDETAALAANPAAALSDKAVLLTQMGRMDEAVATFDRALGHDPTLAAVWYNKANAKAHKPGDPDIAAMENLIEGTGSPYQDRLWLHFALGKAHMDAGDMAAAFRHWDVANRMKRAIVAYDGDAAATAMAAIATRPIDAADAAAALTAERLSDLPVFVVGMPRSGSSLLEQILASHPMIHGAGEQMQLRALFEAAQDAARDDEIAEAALARLRRFSADARRIIDKDLLNYLHLGTIHRIFPQARIIHCRRDPLDTCFSAYTKLFNGHLDFTYDLGELGRYYRAYTALMAHWRHVLPQAVFLEVDYETLVADPAGQTRRMLDFLGLPWDDICLRFFETRRTVNTASLTQVRQPIYRSSIGRAQELRQYLDPLIEALGTL